MSTGSHRAHVSRGYTYNCDTCHSGAGSTTALHADGKVQVTIPTGGTYSQAGKNAGAFAYGTCATTACHMSTIPTWGTPTSVAGNCQGCHDNDRVNTGLSGVHNNHLNKVTTGGSFKCADCHALVITNTDNRTIANKALHANSVINYSGAKAGGSAKYSTVTKSCSAYCHSNGRGNFVNMTGSKLWTASATVLGCNGCHGRSGTTGAPDNVTNDSHTKHAPTAADCWKCHFKTASKTLPGQLATGTVDHLDATLDARLAKPFSFANTSGAYSGARNCSATYCHGTAATQAWGQVGSTNCNSCHKSKWNGSVVLPDAHKFHVISTSANYNYSQAAANNSSQALGYNFNCATCHASGTAPKTTHINGPLSATSGAAEVYFGYTSALKNGSTTYVPGTVQGGTDNGFSFTNGAGCNTTYCHSNGQAVSGSGSNGLTNPDWATTTGAGTCAQCHGNEGNASTLSGAHNKHINGTIGGAYKCKDCHATTITNADNRTLANKANHVNKMVNYSGQYAGRNKNCSNFYCHSYGTTLSGPFTVKSAPVWTGSVTCYSCHGGDSTTGLLNNMSTGRHKKHMVGQYSYGCAVCHAATVSSVNNTTISNASNHVNEKINVSFSGLAKNGNANAFYTFSTHAPGVTGTVNDTCSNVYCHSNAQTGGQVGTTFRFRNLTGVKRFNQTTTVSLGCSNCHSSSSTTSGPWTLSGEHLNHVSLTINPQIGKALACNDCHANGGTNLNKANHANGIINYSSALGGSSARGNLKLSTGRCSNIYCHSNGQIGAQAVYNNMSTVAWFSGAKFGCNGCHGNAANAASLSAPHNAHINGGAATGGMFNCKDCHASTLNISFGSNTTLNASGNHVNAYRNFSGAMAYKTGYNDVAGTCSTYCHTDGKKGAPAVAVTWSAQTIDCSGCHAAGGIASGSHAKHIADGATCKFCHSGTTTNDTSITGTKHIDGFVNISSAAPSVQYKGKNVTFKAVGTTCNNISCHSAYAVNNSSATWGVAATCDTCHPKAGLSGAHQRHMGALDLTSGSVYYNMTANRTPNQDESLGNQHGFGCANCHPMNASSHINGVIEVDLNRVNVPGVSTLRFLNHSTAGYAMGTTKKCSNMYCHSNASRVEAESNVKSNTSLAWTDKFANYTGISAGANRKERCAQCHLNQPTTGAHAAHAVGNHTNNDGVMLDGNIYNGKSGKLAISNRANTAHGNPNNSTTIGCYICHNGVVTSKANDKNVKCSVCHYIGNSYGATLKGKASIANIGLHVNGARDIQFAPIKVVSKAQIRNESFKFYSGVWQRSSYKNMSTLSFDTAKNALNTSTMWLPGAPMASSCQNIACHNGKTNQWNLSNWNDPNKCMDCHNQL